MLFVVVVVVVVVVFFAKNSLEYLFPIGITDQKARPAEVRKLDLLTKQLGELTLT